jgi:signal transduction histidine kinase
MRWRRLRDAAWWWLPLVVALVLGLAQLVPPIDEWRLRGAEVQSCDGPEAPVPNWPPTKFDVEVQCVVFEYRPQIGEDSAVDGSLGVLVTSAHQDVAIDINGVRVRDLAPLDRHSHQLTPILVPVGSGLFDSGENVVRLEIRVRDRYEAPVTFRRAYLGPIALLDTWYQRHRLLQAGGARATLVLMSAMLLFLVPIAAVGPPNPALRWYPIAIVVAGVYVLLFASTWRPPLFQVWDSTVLFALVLSLASFTRMSEIELGARPSRLPFALCVAAAGLIFGSTLTVDPGLWALLNGGGRLILLALLVNLAWRWWRHRDASTPLDPRWFVGGVGLLLALGISDSLTVLWRSQWPAIAYLLHWGVLYLLALMFVALIVRLLAALRTAEQAQQQLGAALAERTRELTAEFALRREAESARMLAEERQRIMRDMHDGVGGQLVALMTQVRSGTINPVTLASEIRRTLDELRLMIDSLDPACADLSVALGMLRRRSEGLAGVGGPVLDWRTAHLPDLPPLPPAVVLHVLRIVQEALGNALKHADARRIAVEAAWDGARVHLAVIDDGKGVAREGTGRGLVHMRERAAAIGAHVAIDSGPNGTRVALDLAIPPSDPDPAPPVSG